MSEPGQERLEVLVIDSGAIIRGHGTSFHRRAERFVTVQEVLAEIRDSKSRDLLAALPFELEVRSPSDESMAAVAAFAKKSGDFAALSMTDLKLIALTYTVEKELTGGASIRMEPRRAAPSPASRAAAAKPPRAPRASKAIPEGEVVDSVIYSLDDGCCCADGAAGAAGAAQSHSHQDEGVENGEEDGEEDGEDGEDGGEDEEEEEGDDEVDEGEEEGDDEDDVGDGEEEEEESEDADGEDEETEVEVEGDAAQESESSSSAAAAAAAAAAEREQPAPLSEQDFPSMGGPAPAAPKAAAGPSSWASVAKSGDTGAFNRKQPARPQPYKSILPSAAAVATADATDADASVNASAAGLVNAAHAASDAPATMPSRILGGNANGHSAQASLRAALEDDGEGWINTSNFKSRSAENSFRSDGKSAKAAAAEEGAAAVVGCITTDFSMQNVLMQMGLHVVSVDGMVVRTVKQWVLRCMACYQVHYAMDRLFCEKCGANHLSRVSCSIDASTGQLRLHLKKGYTPSTRGKLYSLPKPGQQGRYEGELLLREDQLSTGIWKQKKMAVARAVKSAFGEDVTGDVGMSVNKMAKIRVGLGKQNPNAAKGRERRGKAKK